MPYLNRVQLLGHLGQDPELRYTSGGSAVCEISIATTERWNDKSSGKKQEKTTWHKCIFWGQTGERVADWFAKGDLIYVEGKIDINKWEDREGNNRYTTQIVCQNFLNFKKKSENDPENSRNPQENLPIDPDQDDPIPF